MKHAEAAALDQLKELLVQLRQFSALTEKKPGIFYHKNIAFLHFHEDPAGFFADLKHGKEFRRFPVSSQSEQALFLAEVATLLAGKPVLK